MFLSLCSTVMFCEVKKTGRRYVGSCESLPRRLHRHNTGQMKATKHGVPWILIHSESSQPVVKRYKESFITKPDAVATISIHSCRAVAAATGRRFKSCRPDMLFVDVSLLRSAKPKNRPSYVGSCEDRDERLRRHNAGESKATQHGVPWVLVHSEEFPTRREAIARERYYKTGRGRDDLNTFV
jgi:putative endonuclease